MTFTQSVLLLAGNQNFQKRPVTGCPGGRSAGVSLGLVREKPEKSVLSLDTRFSSGIHPGPSLDMFHED